MQNPVTSPPISSFLQEDSFQLKVKIGSSAFEGLTSERERKEEEEPPGQETEDKVLLFVYCMELCLERPALSGPE